MKLLIVDDSELLQARLKKAIADANDKICICQAFSCMEASESFVSFEPDILILDIALPDGSGIDLLKKFKKENPAAIEIILTNYPTEEFNKRCKQLGADHFFDKSNLSGLLIAIHRYFVNNSACLFHKNLENI